MKNLFHLAISLPLLLGGCGGQKEKQTKKPPKLEHQANGNEITITKAHNLSEAFTIPSLIEGIPVTKIGNSAFAYSEITSITIPEGVTDIGERAFNSCKNLKKITIPSSVASIGDFAFYMCGDLVLNFEGNCPQIDGDLGDLFFYTDPDFVKLFKNVEDEHTLHHGHKRTNPTILRQPNAAGWSDEWVGAPVKLISEKP